MVPAFTATLALVTVFPVIAGASTSKSANAVRAWARSHIRTLDTFGNDLNSVDITPIANVAQCRHLAGEVKRVMQLPPIPQASVEGYWKKGTKKIYQGAQACTHAKSASQTSRAYNTMEIGAEALQVAAAAINGDGGRLNFGGAPALKPPSTTT